MAEIISMRKKEDWSEEIHRVFLKRQDLMWTKPIMSEEITRLDMWLVQQPKLPLDCVVAIWSRAMFCEWVFYGDATAELKHLILLRLREHYREFQKLPQRWHDVLWPMWERWRAEFLDEEMEEANGAA
jgi:hypothetical protein